MGHEKEFDHLVLSTSLGELNHVHTQESAYGNKLIIASLATKISMGGIAPSELLPNMSNVYIVLSVGQLPDLGLKIHIDVMH